MSMLIWDNLHEGWICNKCGDDIGNFGCGNSTRNYQYFKKSELATHNYISTDSNLNSQIIIISPWQINKPMLFFIEEDNGKYYELLEEGNLINDWLNSQEQEEW